MLKSNIKSNIALADSRKREGYLFTGYSKRKLHCLSKTYGELARLYRSIPQENTDVITRRDILHKKQLQETKNIFANHLDEISAAFADVANTVMHIAVPVEHKKKALIHYLKKRGVLIREIVFLEDEYSLEAKNRISVEAKVNGRYTLTADELCVMISEFFDRRLMPSLDGGRILTRYYDTFIFEDEPVYTMVSATARAVKENEKISGDNYSLEEYNQSQVVMMISDGMGSGEQAHRDSKYVIELMENLFDAGFSKEKAFAMVNSAMASQTQACNLTTLDLCSINMLTGDAEFIKAGAVSSYLKRRDRVEEIDTDTLPLGSMEDLCPMTQSIRLKNGDMLIMVSDGILDSFGANARERFENVILKLETSNPKQMSDYLLQCAISEQGGRIRDDMTVMVVSIWENTASYSH